MLTKLSAMRKYTGSAQLASSWLRSCLVFHYDRLFLYSSSLHHIVYIHTLVAPVFGTCLPILLQASVCVLTRTLTAPSLAGRFPFPAAFFVLIMRGVCAQFGFFDLSISL